MAPLAQASYGFGEVSTATASAAQDPVVPRHTSKWPFLSKSATQLDRADRSCDHIAYHGRTNVDRKCDRPLELHRHRSSSLQ